MDFYIGWSHSDAFFCEYFDYCPMLISAVPDNRRSLKRFSKKPNKLIVDSGSFFYSKLSERPNLKEVYDIQLGIINDADGIEEIRLVHYDEPMFKKKTLSQKFEAMERTLYNAMEYLHLFRRSGFSDHIKPMGVIQGYDLPSIQNSAYELHKMGYEYFGIGSMLVHGSTKQIEYIEHAVNLVGADRLHVFGVTGIPQIETMVRLQVSSFDSTRPTMAAAYYQVFYSDPFKCLYLKESRVDKSGERIEYPRPCDCPVCKEKPEEILIPSPRHYMRLRSVHNYYHLLRKINQIKIEKRGDSHAISNVLWS